MKVSVCITVKNEENSINRLIESLLSQTKRPDEIIIVDGGSSDNTLSEISKFQTLNSNKIRNIKFKILKSNGATIAQGRNLAIQHARNEIIAMIDAECVAKKDWLAKLTKPFTEVSIGIHSRGVLVCGYYEMPFNNPLQQVLSVYMGIPPQRFNEYKFLPSARSVAFTKTLWKKVGKFNEHLDKAGEDTEFFRKCVQLDVKVVRVKEARVVWKETAKLTLLKGLKKFFTYATGDAQSASHNINISLIFLRYLVFVATFFLCHFHYIPYSAFYILVGLYVIYPIVKWIDIIKSVQGRIWLPIVQISSDFAVMAGYIHGIIKK